ncbi:MAG: type II CAAX endopeptidase family protein [Cyanobacteriota bacterium]|nr:type II CAAX endopeptidase family protein [Cyanobacteriota bacterium]
MHAGPSWRGTVCYPAVLVGLFLALQLVARGLGLPDTAWPLFAAPWALLALMLSLPFRLRRVWREAAPWRRLGVIASPRTAGLALVGGGAKALALLAPISVLLLWTGMARWQPALTWPQLANALALGLGVGVAEELLFRGWLWGELAFHLGRSRGAIAQALLFSLVHVRFDLGVVGVVGLLGGLALLGLVLALQRWADGGLLWGAVGLHGGLVGGWFALRQGGLAIRADAPLWLVGPGGAQPNPVGGLLGWLGLGALLLVLVRTVRGQRVGGIADNARSCP